VGRTTFALISRTLVVAALGMLSAGVASGAAFRVGFDPQFEASGTFANLGFEGTGDLTIDDGCFNSTGEFTVGSGSCTFAFFTSLTLDLYNFADGPGTILETLTYAPPNQDVGGVVSHIVVDAPGDLVGIDTLFYGPQFATAITGAPTDPLPNDSNISMQFVANFVAFPFSVNPNVLLQICDTNGDNCTTSTGQATVTFTRITSEEVPEPASTILALTALGALGWMQRRRARPGRG